VLYCAAYATTERTSNMNSDVAAVLVERGEHLFRAAPKPFVFAGVPAADALLSDLAQHPHAFVLACVMDRQIKAERAWLIPYRVSEALGGFSFERLLQLSLDDIRTLLSIPEPLHRFPGEMSRNFHDAIRHIHTAYGGNAARIWSETPSSAEVVIRFLQFRGVGPKIATMAANILAREFKIPLANYFAIDVSADVQVRRVFWRLGLTAEKAGTDEVIYTARALHPAFPGIVDLPAWEIGRTWCRPQGPRCSECYMRPVCRTGRTTGSMG
jgi:endonuclease III